MTATEAQPNTDGNGDGGVAALVAQEVQPEGETQGMLTCLAPCQVGPS